MLEKGCCVSVLLQRRAYEAFLWGFQGKVGIVNDAGRHVYEGADKIGNCGLLITRLGIQRLLGPNKISVTGIIMEEFI